MLCFALGIKPGWFLLILPGLKYQDNEYDSDSVD